MKRSTLVTGVFVLGGVGWLASRVVDTHPAFALATVAVVLAFGAFAADHPYRS